MSNNDIDIKYKNILDEIRNLDDKNKSIDNIMKIMNKIDDLILSSNKIELDKDFVLVFYSLMKSEYNNSYVGEIILDDVLSKKEKISPSLIIYYYMKQKEKINSNDYNLIIFTKEKYTAMATSHFDDTNDITINYDYYFSKYLKNEEFNYQVMESIMHEIYHIYQFSINLDSDNIYERLIYNDIKIWKEFLNINSMLNYIALHDYFMIEFQAFINSKTYMVEYAKNNSRYFSDEIIGYHEKENIDFFKKYTYSDMNPRELFNDLIEIVLEEEYDYFTDEEYDEILVSFNSYLEKEKELVSLIKTLPDTREKLMTGCLPIKDKINEDFKKSRTL